MKRVMVDIETLSTNKYAAVLSIGVAVFNDKEVLDTNGWSAEIKEVDGHIDPSTVAWWMKQSDDTRHFSFTGSTSSILIAAELRPYITDADEIWANDPDFDMVILQHWWERSPKLSAWPANYRKYRSVRTMMMLASRYYIPTEHIWAGRTAHHPIEDAAAQARVVMEIFHHLDRRHAEMLR